jgi:hypothetical protein
MDEIQEERALQSFEGQKLGQLDYFSASSGDS